MKQNKPCAEKGKRSTAEAQKDMTFYQWLGMLIMEEVAVEVHVGSAITRYVTLDKSFPLSKPQVIHLQSKDNIVHSAEDCSKH